MANVTVGEDLGDAGDAHKTSTDWRQEMVALLLSANQADWGRAYAIRGAHLPRLLYRYRAPDERSFTALACGTVWASDASKFNDLLDTSVVADASHGMSDRIKSEAAAGRLELPAEMLARIAQADDAFAVLDDLFAESVASQAGPEAGARAKNFFRNFAGAQSTEMATRLTQWFQGKTKVVCFSETFDAHLLWAHYARSHEGFCVEYPIHALPADDLRRRWLWPVIYSDERFSFTSFVHRLGGQMNIHAPQLAAMHKASGWAYEREWRLVDVMGDDVPGREFLMPRPSRIFLGSRMSSSDRERVAQIAAPRSIPLFEVSPDPQGQALRATRVV
jgi:hypothetical protein